MNERVTRESYFDRTSKGNTPQFNSESSLRCSRSSMKRDTSLEKLKESANSTSVANCIRALNQKASFLTEENNNLRKVNAELIDQMKTISDRSRITEETREIICSYKEKCLILEQSNEIFQKKVHKLEELNSNNETLRAEMILMNKELSREIEKNQGLNLANNRLQDEKFYLQQEIEKLNEKLSMSTRRFEEPKQHSNPTSGYYEGYKLKESENNNRILEDLLQKQQDELDDKRKQIECLKKTILDFENNIYDLKKQNQKSDSHIQEISEINENLVKALRKKNCKHRAATPDLQSTNFISKSHSGTSLNNFMKDRAYRQGMR